MYSYPLISTFLIVLLTVQHRDIECNQHQRVCIFIGCSCLYNEQSGSKLDKVVCRNQSFDQLPKRFPPAQPIKPLISLVDISHNAIENVPDGSFTGLRVGILDLSRNQISSIGKRSFLNITAIDTLQLASNSLTEISAEQLEPMQYSLRSLVLSLNGLNNSPGTNFAFNRLEYLEHLDLSHNKLVRIPRLNDLSRLRTLIINDNSIETLEQIEDSSSFIQHLTAFPEQLQELHIRGNRLASVNLNWLANLHNLEVLDLSANQIAYINKDAFRSLVNLKQLLLNNNNLNRIPSDILFKLSHLTHFDMSFQKTAISRIENFAFDRENPESRLVNVNLAGNQIEELSNLAFCSNSDSKSRHVSIENLNLMRNKLFNTNPCILKQLNSNKNPRHQVSVALETSYAESNESTPVIDCFNCDPINYLQNYKIYSQLQVTCMPSKNNDNLDRIRPAKCDYVEIKKDICEKYQQYDCYKHDEKQRALNNNGTSVQFGSIGVISLLAIVFIVIIFVYTC